MLPLSFRSTRQGTLELNEVWIPDWHLAFAKMEATHWSSFWTSAPIRHIHGHTNTLLHILAAYSNPLHNKVSPFATFLLCEKVSSKDKCGTAIMNCTNSDLGVVMCAIHFYAKVVKTIYLSTEEQCVDSFAGDIKDYMYH